jgi:putative transposase
MYFITICVKHRAFLFGEIVDGHMRLNKAGEMVEMVWKDLSQRFSNIEMDYYIVMPNHFHGIIQICRGESCIRQ